jgi:hypothetical protein
MCPKCKNFTNAPIGQRRRRCSYCGTIIDVTKANVALFDGTDQTMVAVKEFNASRGGDEFQKAVERSRERYQFLLPKEPVHTEEFASNDEQLHPAGRRARLISILQKEAHGGPCTIDHLEKVCSAQGLDWSWVENAIQSLSNSGALIFPHPWEVQLVHADEDTSPEESAKKDVASEIISFLKTRKRKARVDEIIDYFKEKGISEDSVDSSLERLIRSGDIFQPVVGYVSLV